MGSLDVCNLLSLPANPHHHPQLLGEKPHCSVRVQVMHVYNFSSGCMPLAKDPVLVVCYFCSHGLNFLFSQLRTSGQQGYRNNGQYDLEKHVRRLGTLTVRQGCVQEEKSHLHSYFEGLQFQKQNICSCGFKVQIHKIIFNYEMRTHFELFASCLIYILPEVSLAVDHTECVLPLGVSCDNGLSPLPSQYR